MSASPLIARGITRRHGARTVLEAVDITVSPRARIGLIGPNGSGKSTLLRILAGVEPADAGSVESRGAVGYVPQLATPDLRHLTAADGILERIGVGPASRELDRRAAALDGTEPAAIEAHSEALERWMALGGADADARISRAAAELALDRELLARPLESLSGGQAARAGLAAVAAARFDVLLLDEPSNHLDADGLRRLSGLLRESQAAIVLVSHDRDLLAATVDEVVALERDRGGAIGYAGGWVAYERERDAAHRRAEAAYLDAIRRRAKLIEAEHEMRRRSAESAGRVGGRGRDADKNAREWVRARAAGVERRASRVATRADRDPIPDKPRDAPRLGLSLTAAERRGGPVVALEGAVVRRGEWRLGPLDVAVDPGGRILLDGANGAGKSSLLAALSGRLDLEAGRRRLAPGAAVGMLGQEREAPDGDTSVAAALARGAGTTETDARTALASFGLGADVAERPWGSLSAGERTRAELTLLGARRVTCLLLDEPTNHLDVESLEILERALDGWPGALVVATHDGRLRELRLDSRIEVAPEGAPGLPDAGGS